MTEDTQNGAFPTPATADLKGAVVVTRRGPVTVHSYVSPADSFMVNTQIVEGPNQLVIFDGQATKPYAGEVATYVQRLGKPVERIVISHGHPDHWSGLEILKQLFPGVDIYALPHVSEFVEAAGPAMLGNLQRAFGDKAASQVTLPTRALAPGEQTIDGVRFDFRELVDGEANFQLLTLLPDQRVMLAFDLVYAAHDHMFTVQPTFDQWIGILEDLQAMPNYDTIVVGHGPPTDRSAFDANIAYLRRAREIHRHAADGHAYAGALKAAFPHLQQPGWADFSGMILYSKH
jgi:glyoxylase-like metal-dependent hydrolase (beta-lactamase superfamily II)